MKNESWVETFKQTFEAVQTVHGEHSIETFFICCAIITFIIQMIAMKWSDKISDLATAGKYSYRVKDKLSFFPNVLLLTASIISLLSCVGIVILRFFVVDLVEVGFSDWEHFLSDSDPRRVFNYFWVYPLLIVLPYLVIFWSGLMTYYTGSMIIMEIEGFFRKIKWNIKRKIERSRARARRPSWW